MRQEIHEHYDRLTESERDFVDRVIHHAFDIRDDAMSAPIPLDGSDPCERAADALAEWVIVSRNPRTPRIA